jgi:hypothetical protein
LIQRIPFNELDRYIQNTTDRTVNVVFVSQVNGHDIPVLSTLAEDFRYYLTTRHRVPGVTVTCYLCDHEFAPTEVLIARSGDLAIRLRDPLTTKRLIKAIRLCTEV